MKIGNITLENNVFLAPMAGVTDLSFRLLCKEQHVGLLYTEMVSAKGLYYGDRKTEELMKIEEEERPVSLQIFGSDADIMSNVVKNKLNHREDIDIIDINMGCPTPKIVKNGDGSALLKKPQLIKEIVSKIVSVSNKPVTVKIRTGWDENDINAVEIGKIIEESGATLLAIHGRTREQFYSGEANWDIIRDVKKAIDIPVIGNGDVFTPEYAKRMIEYTNCDGVMIGRGARGNPWLFSRTVKLLNEGILLPEPIDEEKINMCIRHLNLLCKYKGESIAVKEIRKHIGWYIKGMHNSSFIRGELNSMDSKVKIINLLKEYINSIN
ncbi:tRNA dihydrouridine synthase DusB [Clostridium sp. D2Q-14]|uniref:tRNA dihydrouridine synthase DusB n=1 Tax=Anaeromonas gelatinilytica TaxID=2683194 RepID=UPI00193B260D|nr:tRNA dihydrouridine synthase DusB [Anaeromonas gelatinilytica]